MPCYYPLSAYRTASGAIVFHDAPGAVVPLELPCGQCVGCRLERSRQWAMRCLHESQMHRDNCFITLTYDNDHLPRDMSLCYPHYQLFMKRLRKRFSGKNIRFYMCGEYGEETARPHYHACLFGIDFADKVVSGTGSDGDKLYRSSVLESLWTMGHSMIGDVTFKSAAYVARYIMAKITGDKAEAHYRYVDTATGEVYQRVPEFNHMSLKPGIGATWYAKFKGDVYPRNYTVVNGHKVKPPKYYDKLSKKDLPFDMDVLLCDRGVEAAKHAADNTRERLEVRAIVARAQNKLLKRSN